MVFANNERMTFSASAPGGPPVRGDDGPRPVGGFPVAGSALVGRFSAITVQGFKVTPTYTDTALLLHIDA